MEEVEMNEKDIQEHKKKYPLPFDELCVVSTFEQILGKKRSDYSDEERKLRWEKVMSLDLSGEAREEWEYSGDCTGCKQLDNGWCKHMGLPCGINPVLTFRLGMPGLACQGMGYVGDDEESE